jgi:hypothetical protein
MPSIAWLPATARQSGKLNAAAGEEAAAREFAPKNPKRTARIPRNRAEIFNSGANLLC